jgi:hypothetical protein
MFELLAASFMTFNSTLRNDGTFLFFHVCKYLRLHVLYVCTEVGMYARSYACGNVGKNVCMHACEYVLMHSTLREEGAFILYISCVYASMHAPLYVCDREFFVRCFAHSISHFARAVFFVFLISICGVCL